jgi:predicted transcriptional regulator
MFLFSLSSAKRVSVAQWLGIAPSPVSKALHRRRKPENKGGISKIIREILATNKCFNNEVFSSYKR